MEKTMSQLLANSFDCKAHVTEANAIALPDKILRVMGRELKGEYCRDRKHGYLLVSKTGDDYFVGDPLTLCNKELLLSSAVAESMSLSLGDTLLCFYSGAGDYFTIKKAVK